MQSTDRKKWTKMIFLMLFSAFILLCINKLVFAVEGTKVTIRGNINTTVILTDVLTENQYVGILESSKDLIYKNLDYGTYAVSCANPFDVDFIETNVADNQFILSAQNPETIVTVDNQQTAKPGFYSIIQKNIVFNTLHPIITVDPDTVVILLGSEYDILRGVTAIDRIYGDITSEITMDTDLNINQVGIYTVTYTVSNIEGGTATATRTITVINPIIIVEPDTVILTRGSTYDVLTGVTAIDAIYGDITSEIEVVTDLNTNVLGVYTVTYTVYNAEESVATATRTIIIINAPTPVITIDPKTVTITKGSYYDPLTGVTATDYIDGDITSEIVTEAETIDVYTVGTYTATYTVTNSSGITSTDTRTIIVDHAAPVITMIPETISVMQGISFDIRMGVSAIDVIDGDITSAIITGSNVDINTVGIYTVTYTVTNTSRKTTIATRTVNVTAIPPPPLLIDANKNKHPFIDQIANNNTAKNNYLLGLIKATDFQNNNISSNVIVTDDGGFNPSAIGNYTISYQVTDINSRTSILTLTVTVWNFVKISNGQYFGLALGSDGSVWSWGYNNVGQRGLGHFNNAVNYRSPTQIPQSYFGNLPVIDITTGFESSFALNSAGQAYSWGQVASYQLGNGTNSNQNRPVPIRQPIGIKFTQISHFYATGAAIGSDGNVYTWGLDTYGSNGNKGSGNKQVPSAITSSGDFIYVSQGYYGGAAVNSSGQVYVWGTNLEGEIGIGNTTGYNHKPTLVPNLSNVKKVSYGQMHVLALTNNGEVYAWGNNGSGRLGLGNTTTRSIPTLIPSLSNVSQINATLDFSQFRVGNNIYSCGYSNYGELFTGTNTALSTPYLSNMANVAGNVSYIAGSYDNAYILSVDGKYVYGIGYCDSSGQEFGSTVTQTTSNATAIPWTFVPVLAP